MITLTFDRGLQSERSVLINSYNERPLVNHFTGSYNAMIDKQEDVPSFPQLSDKSFVTVHAVREDGVELPMEGDYNIIADCVCNYGDQTRMFAMTITLGKAVTENAG